MILSKPTRFLSLILLLTAIKALAAPGDQLGLELRLVPVNATGDSIARALRNYQKIPTGIDPEIQTRLKVNGLRVIAVPIADLQSAMGSLTPIGTIQSESLGMLYRWTPIFTGPKLGQDYLALDTGTLSIPPGRLRLLARAWVVPDLSSSTETGRVEPRLRLELIPQHEKASRSSFQGLLNPGPSTIQDAGILFKRLHITTNIPPGFAIVIVPARPELNWNTITTPETEPAPPTDKSQPGPFGPSPADIKPTDPNTNPQPNLKPLRKTASNPMPGPNSPQLRTLGEQLLRRPAEVVTEPGPGRTQTIYRERSLVIVLIPHVPSRYALIP